MPRNSKAYERKYDPNKQEPLPFKTVKAALYSIWEEHTDRINSKFKIDDYSIPKSENAKNFFKREVYTLGLHMIENKPSSYQPKDLIDNIRDSKTTRPDASPQTFYALLMCVYSDKGLYLRQERWLMAQEMKYARRHKILPELLCGFLLQSGSRKDINKKLKANYIEPAFRDKITIDDDE